MAEIKETPKPTEVSKDARMWGMLCHLLGLFTMLCRPIDYLVVKEGGRPVYRQSGQRGPELPDYCGHCVGLCPPC